MDNGSKGRGAGINTRNRFSKLETEYISEEWQQWEEPVPNPKTRFIEEESRTLLSVSDSPDLGHYYSVNPYRGCEHGCVYCYARNSHEYWGFSAGLDFETKIIVKKNAPQLLEKLFDSKNWQPKSIHLSGNTDCYQPGEKTYRLTRQLLEICLRYRNPVSVLTKNALILRDIDVLEKLAALNLVHAAISITSLNEDLRAALEPRTVTAKRRLQIVKSLHEAGIPVGVMTAPIIPGLNDHEIPSMIQAAAENGAVWSAYTVVRLNGAVGAIFEEWINRHFPDRAAKVLSQIAACHGGSVNDSRFGLRMTGEGPYAENIKQLHKLACRKYFKDRTLPDLDTSLFIKGGQMKLF
ncbi:PA0069 family radical SAM protein [Dyadobacter sediminis]|uniref:PA0069 family radical SAM protein n=1 Tax=Dyadobacter sediminis TaxID=1493691 RepID=A0A5R9KA80_9BACT|nr:PA0069 family radical SAM protein [Dyadobacter sediminis]TLU91675.1 PA0069 family radical SAM protein [Dyadobacter sediminis]GGC01287.1 radical SAM protein [Dyadobacter sediminis]